MRKPKSAWAPSNKRRVERLIEQGEMMPAGLAVIEAAKRDGSWNRLDDAEALIVPVDLADAGGYLAWSIRSGKADFIGASWLLGSGAFVTAVYSVSS